VFHAQVIQADPCKLHGLSRQQEWRDRDRREATLEEERRGGVVDGKHEVLRSTMTRADRPQWGGRIEDVSLRGLWQCGRPA